MPPENHILHASVHDLRLPYRSFDSPTATDVMWQDGRNCYSNARGYLERRPGFGSAVEMVPTTFRNVQRLFLWDRWAGTSNEGFYLMISDLDGVVAKVYKYHFGYDVSAQLIFTSASSEPFDFVESNNWCFFGNGTEMMKYDGQHLFQWGIVAPSQAPALSTDSGYVAGTSDTADGYYYVASYGCSLTGHESSSSPLTPKVVPQMQTKIVSTKVGLYGDVTAYYWGDSDHSTYVSSYYWCNPSDAAAISSGATPRTVDASTGTTKGSSLLFDESRIGTTPGWYAGSGGNPSKPVEWVEYDQSGSGIKIGTQPVFPSPLESAGYQDFNMCIVTQIYIPAPGTYTFSMISKDGAMWGLGGGATWAGKGTLTPAWYDAPVRQTMTVAKALPMLPVNLWNDGGGTRTQTSVDVTFPAAGLYDFEVDWDYWYHGGRTLQVQIDGADVFPCIVSKSLVLSGTLQLTASSDSQVDQIHVYRTTLGGSFTPSKMQELPSSPYPNTTAAIADSAEDSTLQLSYAPGFYSNNPPPASKGSVWSQNRIWNFAGNTLYYSGFEEIIKGVPEECWPAGVDGNYHPYKRAIHALAAMPNGVDVLTAATQFGVDGDSLDTFRWLTLSEKRGSKTRQCALTLGSAVIWFDTSKQIWSSGGSTSLASALGQYQWRSQDSGEIGLDIRPDLETVDPSNAAMCVHIFGQFHWLVFQDGGNGKLWVLNLDTGQWQVPWTVNSSALVSGETADGQVDLICALDGKTLVKLTPEIVDGAGTVITAGTFTDYKTPYDAWVRGNLFALGKGEQTAVVDYLEVERNSVPLMDVLQANDDDTHTEANYTSIFKYESDPPQRGNGKHIVAKLYRSNPEPMNTTVAACKRASFELHWGASDKKFELYTLDVAYHPAVGK